jgi:glyoxylase-like metal-dependent hydrolase (beta-lactamase superfamily II)
MGWDVCAVRYAQHQVRRSRVYHLYSTHGRADATVELTYYFWVARRGDDIVVVDTGFQPSWFRALGDDTTWVVPPAQALALVGVDPAAVGTVVLSHLHFDHMGNVELFPHAEVVVQRDEHAFWTGPDASTPPVRSMTDPVALAALERIDAQGRLRLVDGDLTLAPGLELRRLPGHSPGQQGVLVDGTVLLASDAAHFYDEFEDQLPFGTFTDLPAMLATYRTLAAWAADGVTIVPGHDPGVMTRFPAVDPARPDLAVWLHRAAD